MELAELAARSVPAVDRLLAKQPSQLVAGGRRRLLTSAIWRPQARGELGWAASGSAYHVIMQRARVHGRAFGPQMLKGADSCQPRWRQRQATQELGVP
eukprot:8586600-Alexandrium_andersonii.AAC.1